MIKYIIRGAAGLALTVVAGVANAAATGAGTGIESGFAEIGGDLDTLLNGAGGFILIVIAIGLGAIMLAIGRGWGSAVTAFAVALLLGYGVDALKGISGVTADVDMLLVEVEPAQAAISLEASVDASVSTAVIRAQTSAL